MVTQLLSCTTCYNAWPTYQWSIFFPSIQVKPPLTQLKDIFSHCVIGRRVTSHLGREIAPHFATTSLVVVDILLRLLFSRLHRFFSCSSQDFTAAPDPDHSPARFPFSGLQHFSVSRSEGPRTKQRKKDKRACWIVAVNNLGFRREVLWDYILAYIVCKVQCTVNREACAFVFTWSSHLLNSYFTAIRLNNISLQLKVWQF